MFTKSIQDILKARLQQLPELILENDLSRDIDDLIARHVATNSKIAVVDDVDTAEAYGNLLIKALRGRYNIAHVTLPRFVRPDSESLNIIREKTNQADLLIAVGSGTINDLVKRSAFLEKKPYILFPTAASMNGYCSANASIYEACEAENNLQNNSRKICNQKKSVSGCLPIAIYVDMKTLLNAPERLSKAGIGDSLARPTAQADWLLSHYILGTPYEETPYVLTKELENQVFNQADAVIRKDKESVAALFKLLLLSGFGMTIVGSSIPASGAEHMIAHLMNSADQESSYNSVHNSNYNYESSYKNLYGKNLHGEEIAVTSVDMAIFQQNMLRCDDIKLQEIILPSLENNNIFANDYAENSKNNDYRKKSEIIARKFPDYKIPDSLWNKAREEISAIHISADKLSNVRKKAALPENPEKLSWKEKEYKEAISLSRFTRDRFTILDIKPQ